MNYIITYTTLDIFGQVVKQGKMKVKNKLSEFDAKCSLEKHLKKKFDNIDRLIVYKCELENPLFSLISKYAK